MVIFLLQVSTTLTITGKSWKKFVREWNLWQIWPLKHFTNNREKQGRLWKFIPKSRGELINEALRALRKNCPCTIPKLLHYSLGWFLQIIVLHPGKLLFKQTVNLESETIFIIIIIQELPNFERILSELILNCNFTVYMIRCGKVKIPVNPARRLNKLISTMQ